MSHSAPQGISASPLVDEHRPAVLFLHHDNLIVDMDTHAEQSFPQDPATPAGNDSHLFSFPGKGEGK
jgi:hypothetical protein